jgi:hypothetical protein
MPLPAPGQVDEQGVRMLQQLLRPIYARTAARVGQAECSPDRHH